MTADGRDTLDAFLGSVSVFSNTLERLLEEQLVHASGADALTLGQLRLLGLLARGEGMRIGDIARLQCVSDAAASRGVERLVQRGLVTRRESPEDRRTVDVQLTAAGRALLERYRAGVSSKLDASLNGTSTGDLDVLTSVLDGLTRRLLDAMERDDGICFGCNLFFRDECAMRERGSHVCACAVASGEVTLPAS